MFIRPTHIYAISDRGITANNLDNMTITASVPLPGSNYDYRYE
jgi:hypothetical protein